LDNVERADFGVLYGQKTTEDALLIYSSYEDSKSSPSIGDFIVLAPKDEAGHKFLARVEAEVYDEDPLFRSQDKTLVAVHYARIAERELSERDRQKMFSYTYKVRLLGTFTQTGMKIEFTTAVRKLPVVSYHARHLSAAEAQFILNIGNIEGIPLGHLCIGEDVQRDKGAVLFDINRLRNTRTMVFAQSGFGKTNLVKVLLYHVIKDTSYGKLIFDLNGEYHSSTSSGTLGLGDISDNVVKQNLVVYSDRKLTATQASRFTFGGKVQLNTHKYLTVGDVLAFGTGFSDVMRSFLLYLDENQVTDFLGNIDQYCDDPSLVHKKFADFFGQQKEGKEDFSARKTIMAIRKRLRHLIDEGGIHSSTSTLVEKVFEHLKGGRTVIIDLSLRDNYEASIISTLLVRELFDHNKENFTSGSEEGVIPVVLFIEEAQNVLSDEFVKSQANPFVRCAKEGRKFGLGIVAITQRPSAISEEIRTQAENFFAFHLGTTEDVKALVKSNVNYDGVVADFLQTETIRGNLYMVTSEQPFVIPIRVRRFEDLVHAVKS
jgi:DNA helicase HerA-like ATPase